ncbi:MAG: asparagine synthase [Candidatus Cloacimonetes bacterium]|nr:asparagine synthase [Candidatus Cloacimonadota bacterium]
MLILPKDNGYQWHRLDRTAVKGHLTTPEGRLYQDDSLAVFFRDCHSVATYRRQTGSATGNWCVVTESNASILAAVDTVRSFPLFYTLDTQGDLILSDDVYALLPHCPTREIDDLAAAEMLLSAYVFGENTLIKGIKQLLPGTILSYDKQSKAIKIESYYRYRSPEQQVTAPAGLIDELDAILLRSIRRTCNSIGDRPVILALSGGYDSRLVLSLLKRAEVKNIICYSYGMKGNPDSQISRQIARYYGYPWHYAEHDRRSHYEAFNSDLRRDFYRYANHLSVMAHIQDWLAVKELKERGVLPEDGVFMAGHSGDFLVGSYIPSIWKTKPVIKRNDLVDELWRQHYTLWDLPTGSWEMGELIDLLIHMAHNFVHCLKIPDEMDVFTAAAIEEEFDWQERQAKFIINATRVYEFFGHQWRIPLWDEELTGFWRGLPVKYRIDRVLYENYSRKHLPFPRLTIRGSLATRAFRKLRFKLNGYYHDARWARFTDPSDLTAYRHAPIASVCDPVYRYPAFIAKDKRLVDTPINAIQTLVNLKEILPIIQV